jgi:hypothetical protein
VQALFALNSCYFLNEKGSLAAAATFRLRPEQFAETITDVLAATGRTPEALQHDLRRMESLVRATRKVCGLTG